MVKIHLTSQFSIRFKEHSAENCSHHLQNCSDMDWTKIFFCFFLAISNTVSLKRNSTGTETAPKEERISSNLKSLNSTQNNDEILEASPSETIRFQKPLIFREREKALSNNDKDYGKGASVEKGNKEKINNVTDLTKEANRYSAVFAFTETPATDIWHMVPEIFPYVHQNELIGTIPIIESQSFVNKPKISSVQINPSPLGNLEGRNADLISREYPENHSSHNGQGYPESGNNPGQDYPDTGSNLGRGHAVHTETSHDYGRFLPVNYKSKIEKEAEELIKRQKSQNATTTGKPQQYKGENRQRTSGHHHGYQQPVNTAFFHKGNFESAYPFPENNDDRRYTSEEYLKQHYATGPKEPATSTASGEIYGPRQPVTSTETYQPNYSYPSKQYPSPYHGGSHHVDPYPRDIRNEDTYHRNLHHEDPNHRGQQHGDPNHKKSQQKIANYRDQHHESPPHREPQQGNTNIKDKQHRDSYYRGPHHKDFHHRSPHYTELHDAGPPNAPKQYDLSTEKYPPYSDDFGKFISGYPDTTHAPNQYSQPADQTPLQYHNEENKFSSPYTTDFNQPNHHTDSLPNEFQVPYSNKPSLGSVSGSSLPPDSTLHIKDSELGTPQSNGPSAKHPLEIAEEKAYYNTFKSLVDLYKSYGFQPFNLHEIPIILPPRFAFENAYLRNTRVSGPTSGSVSAEHFHLNSKAPIYSGNANSPGDQIYDNYRTPYSEQNYNSKEHISTVRNKNSQYHQHVPFDSNRSPAVSTEHCDTPEISKPDVFNTQIESPKESFFADEYGTKLHSDSKYIPSGDEKINGIRIKDYDPETFFKDPKKNLYNSAESEFSSSASLPDTPLHPHPVVRKNPYNVKSSHSGEAITTYRPRVYRQSLKIEHVRPSVIDSEERTNNFHSNKKTNAFRFPNIGNSRDMRHLEPFAVHNDDRQIQYNPPTSKEQVKPQSKNQQWRPNSTRSSKNRQAVKDVRFHEQGNPHSNRKKAEQKAGQIPFQGEFTYKEHEQRSKSAQSESRSKRKGKRSSHRSPKKHKSSNRSQRDHMRAEGSAYHWGMEKHKGTDGFFQYANVPGAKAFEYGYRMGGPEHTRERHHQTKGIQSKIKVNWEDSNGDSGDHYWEFNHDSREDDTEEHTPKTEKNASE